jgi:hypothetical protein
MKKSSKTVVHSLLGQYMLVNALVNQQIPGTGSYRTTSKLHYFIG